MIAISVCIGKMASIWNVTSNANRNFFSFCSSPREKENKKSHFWMCRHRRIRESLNSFRPNAVEYKSDGWTNRFNQNITVHVRSMCAEMKFRAGNQMLNFDFILQIGCWRIDDYRKINDKKTSSMKFYFSYKWQFVSYSLNFGQSDNEWIEMKRFVLLVFIRESFTWQSSHSNGIESMVTLTEC